jgi:hypothetical protein
LLVQGLPWKQDFGLMMVRKLIGSAALGIALLALPATAFANAEEAGKETPPATIDSNGDGQPDAWDTNGDGRADAWDTNGDGKPDKVDADGDGKPDDAAK